MLLNNDNHNDNDNQDNEDNILDNILDNEFVCTCFDTIKKINYNDYVFDFINYKFVYESYKLHIIQYDNIINNKTYNKIFNLSYFKFDKNNYYFELIDNIYFNFNKAHLLFKILHNDTIINTINFNYTLNKTKYNQDITKILYNNYAIYIYLKKQNNYYIHKIIIHFFS